MPRVHTVPDTFQSSPFRVATALAAGLPRGVINGPQFRKPFHGVRVPLKLEDSLEVRCQTLALILPAAAAFSHATAAELCGLPHPRSEVRIDVTVPSDTPVPKIDGIRGHSALTTDDVTTVKDVRAVSPARTFFDLAPSLSLTDLVVLGDAIVRRWTSLEELRVKSGELKRRRGIVRARAALTLILPGVDSPMETKTRLLIASAGLPTPVVNVDVFDDVGGWIARPDLSYPKLKIAIEYDGDHHRTDKRQWRKDRGRDEAMRDAGWIVITLTADDVLKYPQRTIGRIRQAIAQRRS